MRAGERGGARGRASSEREQEGKQVSARELGWVRLTCLSKSKGAKSGWTCGRGWSKGRWGCESSASTSPAGSSVGATGFRRFLVNPANPIKGSNCMDIALYCKGTLGQGENNLIKFRIREFSRLWRLLTSPERD